MNEITDLMQLQCRCNAGANLALEFCLFKVSQLRSVLHMLIQDYELPQ